jgi:hypothetical protein
VRRDAVRETWISVFFLLTILHWHFRAKTTCKIKFRTSKAPKNDRFLGKWEKLSWAPCCSEMCYKALPIKEIWPVACYRTFPPVRPRGWACSSIAHPLVSRP